MRPPVLNPLFASLSDLPGIGPKLEKVFARLLGRGEGEPPRLIDLLFHLPSGFVDRRNQPKLSAVTPETVVTATVTIDKHRPPPPNRPRPSGRTGRGAGGTTSSGYASGGRRAGIPTRPRHEDCTGAARCLNLASR